MSIKGLCLVLNAEPARRAGRQMPLSMVCALSVVVTPFVCVCAMMTLEERGSYTLLELGTICR